MNTNFNKLIGSAAAVLAMSSAAFAQSNPAPTPRPPMQEKECPCPPFEQNMPLTKCEKFPPAYNAPARTDVKCSWDIFLTGSFIYWNTVQDGMDIGYGTALDTVTGAVLAPTAASSNNTVKFQNQGYQPGFKVGLGGDFCCDGWVGYLEYTWLHTSRSQSFVASPDSRGTGVIALSDWFTTLFSPGVLAGDTPVPSATDVSARWTNHLDLLDATLSRPYYQGRSLTVTPFAGLRAAWIRQNYRLAATVNTTTPPQNPVISHNQSKSWGLGPRAGVQAHWLLGAGFRFEADAGANLLYTRYTTVSHREDSQETGTTPPWLGYSNYGTVRPMADMGVGFAWGSYLDCQNYYLDIAANYDFVYLWNQNMMRSLVDHLNNLSGSAAGDLSYNGLTVTIRFDF